MMIALIVLMKLAWLQGLPVPAPISPFPEAGDRPGYRVFSMTSRAGEPNVRAGEIVLARLERYRGDDLLRRGDLVLANARSRTETGVAIGRIVAAPGDTVAMREGALSIDGKPIGSEAVASSLNSAGRAAALRRETLPGGRSYIVLAGRTDGMFGTVASLKVINRCYFVLGDNRDVAGDSRFPLPDTSGFLCRERIIGRPLLILWSPDIARIGTRTE